MAPSPHIRGHLTVICGPMFAGKSTELIRRAAAATQAGTRAAAFKPRRDTRYNPGAIAAHTGATLACTTLDAPESLDRLTDATLVLIDEAHFFGQALVDPVLTLLSQGRSVVIAGLERDHRGEPFEPFPRLLCEADEVVKLTCPCARCGHPALHSQRLTDSTERIVVGGAESYEPRCRSCFRPGR